MEKMLEIDADKRINAAQTLSHPYLEEVNLKYIKYNNNVVPYFTKI